MLMGAMRFPDRSRRSDVLPAPFAPIKRVRHPGGRSRIMSLRPMVPSGNLKVRWSTSIEGAVDMLGGHGEVME